MTTSPIRRAENGAAVAVRLKPKANRNRVAGVVCQTDGTAALKVEVSAIPQRGKANTELIALLAKTWRIPKTAFTLTAGATSRRKTLHITGDPDELKRTLDEWVATHDG